ncbi:Fc.00g022300.m01.CDS01 [Cosmosporella sp. VM-42]
MLSLFYISVLLASAGLIDGASVGQPSPRKVFRPNLFPRQGAESCINQDLIQSASSLTGQEPGTEGIKPGQAASATDQNNFVNFCQGQEITNGKQITTGSCNGIPMGKIPAVSNMISAMITNPQPGDKIPSDTTFNVSVQTSHLRAGNFVNPTTNYYTAPQDLDGNGDIIGHCHVTVQDIGSLDSTTPPDPSKFAFFKGIDDAGNGQGLLQAVVDGGLPPGTYRLCTMIAAQNHQPVAMPVAQRGAQDDCTKFEVVAQPGSGPSNSQNQKDGDMLQNQDEEGFVQPGDGVNDNQKPPGQPDRGQGQRGNQTQGADPGQGQGRGQGRGSGRQGRRVQQGQ